MYVRAKEVNGETYYQLVQGFRDATGRVRHRTLASLGRHPTIAEALKATERELRKLRRDLEYERRNWPPSSARPASSVARLATLERRLARAEEKRERLKALLDGSDDGSVDTTKRLPPTVPPDMMAEAYVGKDRATLIGNPNGTVDVITTVRGEFHTSWHVPQAEVVAILRARHFTLRYATWPEPRPIHDSR